VGGIWGLVARERLEHRAKASAAACKTLEQVLGKAQKVVAKIPSPEDQELRFMEVLGKKNTSAMVCADHQSTLAGAVHDVKTAVGVTGDSAQFKDLLERAEECMNKLSTAVAVYAVLSLLRTPEPFSQQRKHLEEAMTFFKDGVVCPEVIEKEVKTVIGGGRQCKQVPIEADATPKHAEANPSEAQAESNGSFGAKPRG